VVRFRDRRDAGQRLGQVLAQDGLPHPVVLAIPRGGVPIAVRIAAALGCPWDVVVIRKLAVPWNPEMGFGAVAVDGTTIENRQFLDRTGLTASQVERIRAEALREAERRDRLYRAGRPSPDLTGRSVVLTDDGLASGYTVLAAVEWVKKADPLQVIVATPVASDSAAALVELAADRLAALYVSDARNFAVADFYTDFAQLTDEGVLTFLEAGPSRLCTVREGVSG
jgi:putative phosphoribosyl transferase